jgi:hypothetical protein
MVANRRSTEKTFGRPLITGKNRLVRFNLPLMWGSRPEANYWRLTVPVAAAIQIFYPKSRQYTVQLKSGVGMPEMYQKD